LFAWENPRFSQRTTRAHDLRVAAALKRRAGEFDVVHVWPRAALHTARAARALGIRAVREAPNTHTGYAFDAVVRECELLGIAPPPGHSHTCDPRRLAHEQAEYDAADVILCQSEFSRATFVQRGVPAAKVAVHQNGTDIARFKPGVAPPPGRPAADGAVRRPARAAQGPPLRAARLGALRRRRARRAVRDLRRVRPGYRETVAPLLDDPSVEVRGYVPDLSQLMRDSDVFVLPSVEEGSALVTYEAQACGCVLSVSDATGARCEHRRTGLVHPARNVDALAAHLPSSTATPRCCSGCAPRRSNASTT